MQIRKWSLHDNDIVMAAIQCIAGQELEEFQRSCDADPNGEDFAFHAAETVGPGMGGDYLRAYMEDIFHGNLSRLNAELEQAQQGSAEAAKRLVRAFVDHSITTRYAPETLRESMAEAMSREPKQIDGVLLALAPGVVNTELPPPEEEMERCYHERRQAECQAELQRRKLDERKIGNDDIPF